MTSRLVFNQNPLLHPSAGTTGPEREFTPDRVVDDLDDLGLGAAALDDDAVGEGGEEGGSGLTAGFEDWSDDDEAGAIPRRQPTSDHQGTGSSAVPASHGGAQKRRAVSTHFGSWPEKPKSVAAATKRDKAAAKATRFRKVVKEPQTVFA